MTEPPKKIQAKNKLAAIFDSSASDYVQIAPFFYQQLANRLTELAEIKPGATVLDIATGTGTVLCAIAERIGPTGRVIGVDVSEGMLSRARQHIECARLSNAELQTMDAEQLVFPDASFDKVLCGLGLFFFPQPPRALREFYRVLKPRGRVALTTFGPSFESAVQWTDDLIKAHWPAEMPYKPRRPLRFTDQTALQTVLEEAGFENVQIIEDELELVFPNEEAWWHWLASTAQKGYLDTIVRVSGQAALDELKADMVARLNARIEENKRANGIPFPIELLTSLASKG
jgi:ubiquinone/menaquinone biosynthesis C-methylase UbiE